MGGKNLTTGSLPRMIIREPAESGTIPPLPAMPPEYQYGGAWMDPQWKKNLNGYKKLFSTYPIQMAAILVVTIGLAIGLASLSSTVCSGSSSRDYEFTDDPQFEDDDDIFGGETIESGDPDALLGAPVSGNVGDISVTVLGYKFAEDVNDVSSIMVEYEVVNNGDEPTYFYYLDHKAFQNSVQLTNSFGKTDEYDNHEMILEILPGGVHRVHCLYNLGNTVDPVEIRVSDIMQLSDDVVTNTFDLSGENTPAAIPEENETPDTTTTATTTVTTTTTAPAIVSEGATGDFYIKFIDSSIVTDDWDDPYICAVFDFTNNSEEATSAWSALSYYATQDGNDLSEGTFYFNEEYTILNASVQPGETVRVSLMFSGYDANGGNALVNVFDYWDDENVISYSCPVK